MQIPSFMIPPGSGPGTPKSVDRRRRMAEAMMMEGTSGAPVGHWTQVGARLANALSGGYQMRKADQAESEGMARSRELLAKALQGGDSSSLMEAMNDPYQSQAGLSMLGSKWDQANQPPPDPMEQQMKQLQMQKLQAEVRQIGQQKPTALMQEYEWAKQNGFGGSPLEFINAKKASPDARARLGLNPQYGVDANGNPVLLQIGEDGAAVQTQMPEGVRLSKEPIKLDAGTHYVLLDPITRQPVGQIPKDVAGEAAATAAGKEQGTAQAAIPSAKITAEQTISNIDNLIADPSLPELSGWEAWLPDAAAGAYNPKILGLRRRVEQLRGGAFLEAYNGLRGGGQITEVEGKKAENALARLDAAQSDSDFITALKDFRDAVQTGYAKLGARAGGGAPALNVPEPTGSIDDLLKKYGGQ